MEDATIWRLKDRQGLASRALGRGQALFCSQSGDTLFLDDVSGVVFNCLADGSQSLHDLQEQAAQRLGTECSAELRGYVESLVLRLNALGLLRAEKA